MIQKKGKIGIAQNSRKIYKKILIIVLVLVALYITLFKLVKVQEKVLVLFYEKEYNEFVEKYSTQYGVDDALVYSLIKNESKFDSNAVSASDAKGLMQIMDSTVKDIANRIADMNYEEIDIFDPETNIHLGVNYLSYLLGKYNNVALAVSAYNAGIGNVDNWIENGVIDEYGSNIENIPFKETNIYVRKVLRDYKIFSSIDSKH